MRQNITDHILDTMQGKIDLAVADSKSTVTVEDAKLSVITETAYTLSAVGANKITQASLTKQEVLDGLTDKTDKTHCNRFYPGYIKMVKRQFVQRRFDAEKPAIIALYTTKIAELQAMGMTKDAAQNFIIVTLQDSFVENK